VDRFETENFCEPLGITLSAFGAEAGKTEPPRMIDRRAKERYENQSLHSRDIDQALSMAEAVEVVKDAFVQLSLKNAQSPVRTSMNLKEPGGRPWSCLLI